jgi:hypothetical protein
LFKERVVGQFELVAAKFTLPDGGPAGRDRLYIKLTHYKEKE